VSEFRQDTLDVGPSNCEADYYINGTKLLQYDARCDLGVRVRLICYVRRRLLGLHEMILKAHKRANHIISCFNSGDINLLAKAFIVYAQPILDYNSIIWSPYLK